MSRLAWSQWSIEYVCDPECTCLICEIEHGRRRVVVLGSIPGETVAMPRMGRSSLRFALRSRSADPKPSPRSD